MRCRVVLQAVGDDKWTTQKYENVTKEILGWFPQYVVGVREYVDCESDSEPSAEFIPLYYSLRVGAKE
jgi:hypothetical protein